MLGWFILTGKIQISKTICSSIDTYPFFFLILRFCQIMQKEVRCLLQFAMAIKQMQPIKRSKGISFFPVCFKILYQVDIITCFCNFWRCLILIWYITCRWAQIKRNTVLYLQHVFCAGWKKTMNLFATICTR